VRAAGRPAARGPLPKPRASSEQRTLQRATRPSPGPEASSRPPRDRASSSDRRPPYLPRAYARDGATGGVVQGACRECPPAGPRSSWRVALHELHSGGAVSTVDVWGVAATEGTPGWPRVLSLGDLRCRQGDMRQRRERGADRRRTGSHMLAFKIPPNTSDHNVAPTTERSSPIWTAFRSRWIAVRPLRCRSAHSPPSPIGNAR